MEAQLIEAKTPSDFDLPELRKRSHASSKSKKTVHYRAIIDGRDVAFVSLDRWPSSGHVVLYEIFVPTELRRHGIGGAALAAVERIAVSEGLMVIRLTPRSLDKDVSQEHLIAWYTRSGYSWDHITGEMKKELSQLN